MVRRFAVGSIAWLGLGMDLRKTPIAARMMPTTGIDEAVTFPSRSGW